MTTGTRVGIVFVVWALVAYIAGYWAGMLDSEPAPGRVVVSCHTVHVDQVGDVWRCTQEGDER